MNTKKIRTAIALAAFVVLSAGLIAGISFGTLSGFGWDTISALCPLGAVTTMIASRTFLPRALVSLIVMAVLVLIVGRAFCGWLCPVPLLDRLRAFFRSPAKRKQVEAARHERILGAAKADAACGGSCASCSGCASARKKLDSRHYVLGGALVSTAIFGFPVFCLVCPVGLTFATVLVFWRLFAAGDMTWSVVLIPLMLVIELVFLRKWCTRFCPLSALMNLVGRFSKTFVPTIDDEKCLETAKGATCSRCAEVCEFDINLRHPDFGELGLADCTRCRACVEACPTHAVSMPLLPKGGRGAGEAHSAVLVEGAPADGARTDGAASGAAAVKER